MTVLVVNDPQAEMVLSDSRIEWAAEQGAQGSPIPEPKTWDVSHRDRIGVITFVRACKLLDEAMALKGPDYVYPRFPEGGDYACVNFTPAAGEEGWAPSCLIGHVWNLLGLNPDTCATPSDARLLYTGSALAVAERFSLKLTPKARAVFVAVQYAQDQGTPWGAAIDQSRRVVAASEWDDYE